VPGVKIFRTPLDDPFHYSLFGEKEHPPRESAGEYLYKERVHDAEGRLLSAKEFSPGGEVSHSRALKYGGGLLVEEREEYADAGSVVTRAHAHGPGRETIRVMFDGELDEVMERETRRNGSVASERSTDASGELRILMEYDEGGRVVHSEAMGVTQRCVYNEAGNLVELRIEKDGEETMEKTRVGSQGIEEVEIFESGELVGKRVIEREPGKVRMTETRGDSVIATRVEESDAEGRLVRVDDMSERFPGRVDKTSWKCTYHEDGRPKREDVSGESMALHAYTAPPFSGFREMKYDAAGRLSEVLLCGFGNRDADLEDDSYYRFEYSE
jgi:hypothetical protein